MPKTVLAIALSMCALALVPEKFRPAWIYRPNWWQVLIGLVAVVAALVIVATPEFYALGILGDSAFFDLLALAISIQLQVILSRFRAHFLAALVIVVRFAKLRTYVTCLLLMLAIDEIVSTAQKIAHRISS